MRKIRNKKIERKIETKLDPAISASTVSFKAEQSPPPSRIEVKAHAHAYTECSVSLPKDFIEEALREKAERENVKIGADAKFAFFGSQFATVIWREPLQVLTLA